MEQMFKFLTQFGIIAEKEDFQISKIDIRLPSIKFEPRPEGSDYARITHPYILKKSELTSSILIYY